MSDMSADFDDHMELLSEVSDRLTKPGLTIDIKNLSFAKRNFDTSGTLSVGHTQTGP